MSLPWGLSGTKGDSQCYLGVMAKVEAIHDRLKGRVGQGPGPSSSCAWSSPSTRLRRPTASATEHARCVTR